MGTMCAKLKDEEEDEKGNPKNNSSEEDKKWKIALSNLLLSSKNALRQMERYGNNFVQDNFKMEIKQLLLETSDQRYQWFFSHDEIPKSLGKSFDKSFLDEFDSKSSICKIESWLQKIKIALEIISTQMASTKSNYYERFQESKDFVNAALSEARYAMTELQLNRNSDATDGFIPKEVLEISSESHRTHRDWIFYRESRNTMEGVIQILDAQLKKYN